MAQRQRERHVPYSEGGAGGAGEADEEAEEERAATSCRMESAGGADTVGGIKEVTRPPGERSTPEEGKGWASGELRTAMEGMEGGGEDMDEGRGAEVEQDDAEAEGGGGGFWYWKPQGS